MVFLLRLILLTLLIVNSLPGCAVRTTESASRGTTLDEERLVQKTKDAILQDLRDEDWLAQQVERGIEKYMQKQKAAQELAVSEQARRANEAAKQVRRVSPTRDHIRGNPGAELSLIEYSDFECPYCKQFHQTAHQVVETYAGKVNWVYRHFPLDIHNPGAQKEAEAAECANKVGGNEAFWTYADGIFTRTTSNGQGFPLDKLVPLAKELGLDEQAFQNCLESGGQTDRVEEDMLEGKQIGVSGTPTTVLLHNKTGEVRVIFGAVPRAGLKAGVAQLLEESSQQRDRARQRSDDPSQGAPENARVEYENGMLSMAFNHVPVESAVQELRGKTGIEIVLPAAVLKKALSLKVDRLPLQAALGRFLRALAFDGFVLVYDNHGQPRKLTPLQGGTGPSLGSTPQDLSPGHAEPCPPNCPPGQSGPPRKPSLRPGSVEPCPPNCPPIQFGPPSSPTVPPSTPRP